MTSRPAAGCGCTSTPSTGPCVGELSSPQQRLTAVRDAVADETEPLVTLTHLLRLCRDEHATLWERMNDRDCRHHVECLRADLADELPAPGTETTLSAGLRRALAAALAPAGDIPPVVVARDLAELVDETFGHTFAASFARRSPYQPRVGDPVPLDRPDLRRITDLPATTPPWRLAHRLDETRRVRLAGGWAAQFRVVLDYCLADVLTGLVDRDTVVATCHPNRTVEEFDLPEDGSGRSFPVRPHDLERQRGAIDRQVAAAVRAGASIVVLPELAVTEPLARYLEHWVRRPDGPRLLVTGSFHAETAEPGSVEDGRQRRNTALAWVRGSDRPLVHDKHSPADRPVREDIHPQGWPEVRIYVTADGWHLVLAVCRDLLNPQAVHALSEAGANLVLVPAMSETLLAFGGPAAQLVGTEQALVAVANNPTEWPDDDGTVVQATRALFGHPAFVQQTRPVTTADAAPGIALLHVGSGTVTWSAEDPGETGDGGGRSGHGRGTAQLPPWAERLARRTRRWTEETPATTTVTLRTAAVLVLLSDGPSGPTVLLTERVRDLIDYPGELVFPGGAADPADDGPVGTALREAREEVGLDPGTTVVIGRLPAVALPDSGFLVTPVLAWSPSPPVVVRWNVAEVRRVLRVPLADWRRAVREGSAGASGGPDRPVRCGRMTAAMLDLLASMAGIVGTPLQPAGGAEGERPVTDG